MEIHWMPIAWKKGAYTWNKRKNVFDFIRLLFFNDFSSYCSQIAHIPKQILVGNSGPTAIFISNKNNPKYNYEEILTF